MCRRAGPGGARLRAARLRDGARAGAELAISAQLLLRVHARVLFDRAADDFVQQDLPSFVVG